MRTSGLILAENISLQVAQASLIAEKGFCIRVELIGCFVQCFIIAGSWGKKFKPVLFAGD